MTFKRFSIEITSEQEANAFAQILDWAVRHAGLQGANNVAVFHQKAVQAQQSSISEGFALGVATPNAHEAAAMN